MLFFLGTIQTLATGLFITGIWQTCEHPHHSVWPLAIVVGGIVAFGMLIFAAAEDYSKA